MDMVNSKVLELVEIFSEQELERLKSFLLSPYHNNAYNAEAIVDLFDYLVNAIANKERSLLEKKHLNKRYFPDKDFAKKKKNPIDTLASDLFKKMRDFVFFEYVQQEGASVNSYLSLAKLYRQNSYEERFWQVMGQFRKHLKDIEKRDSWYYLDAFKLEEEELIFRSTFNTYTDDVNLVTAHQFFDQFYVTQKLEIAAGLILQKQFGEIDDEGVLFLSEIIEEVFEDYPAMHTPLARLFKIVNNVLKQGTYTKEEIVYFKEQLDLYEAEIAKGAFRNLMAFYRTFLVMFYRKESSGSKLLFETYKEHMKKGYFQVEDKILPASLKSVVNIGLKLGEIKWTKKVLADYPPERITGTRYPQETHSLCEAEILFANQEYAAALDKLIYRNFENVNYSILADVLLVKIYYMTEDELVYSRSRALEQKIRRTKLTKEGKASYLSFLKFLNQVLKYEHDKTSKKWQRLKEKMGATPMIEREWLQHIMEK
jgi:hypothetical protein